MLPLSSMPPISLLPPFMVCCDGDQGFRLVFVGIKHCSAKRNESCLGERALPYQIHPLLSSWLVNPSFSADIVVDVSAYDSLLLDLGVKLLELKIDYFSVYAYFSAHKLPNYFGNLLGIYSSAIQDLRVGWSVTGCLRKGGYV
ncbi:hypothetical protein Tco_1452623 [Tanacetum coccineum]